MKKTTEEQMSRCRQRMQELGQEYRALVGELVGRGPLVRGTVNWHERASGRYPGLTRGEGGTVVGRRIRLEHMEWLEPLLERHKAYRHTVARLRKTHQEVMAVAEEMRQARLYDYEPRAEASAYLVKAKGVRHGA
jgi:hypothetical protein